MEIFYTRSSSVSSALIEHALTSLPDKLVKRYRSFHRLQDRINGIAGWLLLMKATATLSGHCSLSRIEYNLWKRPYFSGEADFNISHSGDCVVCAYVESGSVGVDVEQITEIKPREFRQVFSEQEWNLLENSWNVPGLFFRIWTYKEAIMKADGRGLNLEPKTIGWDYHPCIVDGKAWFTKEFILEQDFQVTLAGNEAIEKYVLHQIDIEELFQISQFGR
ncbi:MAG: 4'-phosphopantetheinyl transferase superfamily protein [Candidatus Cloacimonetes bacterium]|nr:4'-phosphopantetheinyl transferase superfamily protein [Candidatus Cloacimonadota bacterium]